MSEEFSLPPVRSYNRRFWEAAAEGRLEIQHCTDCESRVYPPRIACPSCFGDLEWEETGGTGTVYSYTLLHHPDPPGAVAEADRPIVGAIVDLDEGVRIAATLVDCDPATVAVGTRVTAVFEETPDGRAVPKFTPE